MRILEFILLIIVFCFFSCSEKEAIYHMKKTIHINKQTFKVGDEIVIMMKIESNKDGVVYIYDNYRNIDFSFSIVNEEKNIYNEYWSEYRSKSLSEATDIDTIYVSKKSPFIKIFEGKIEEKKDSIYINFPNYKVNFGKDIVKDSNTIIRIHGIYRPIENIIGDSDDDTFIGSMFRISE